MFLTNDNWFPQILYKNVWASQCYSGRGRNDPVGLQLCFGEREKGAGGLNSVFRAEEKRLVLDLDLAVKFCLNNFVHDRTSV